MKSFKHSGLSGDIIFSLPTIRALGGGILYLDPEGGKSDPLVTLGYQDHTGLTRASIDALTPLLEHQRYIKEVRLWNGEKVDFNLDKFRKHITFNNLADSHLAAFNLDFTERDEKWIQVDREDPRLKGKIAISRSLKVQSNHTFWEFEVRKIKDKCVFLGTPKEHEFFQEALGYNVDYVRTVDIYDLAVAINSADSFIGNQSLPHAIAEGLKKTLIQEVYRLYPATIFKRQGAQYV